MRRQSRPRVFPIASRRDEEESRERRGGALPPLREGARRATASAPGHEAFDEQVSAVRRVLIDHEVAVHDLVPVPAGGALLQDRVVLERERLPSGSVNTPCCAPNAVAMKTPVPFGSWAPLALGRGQRAGFATRRCYRSPPSRVGGRSRSPRSASVAPSRWRRTGSASRPPPTAGPRSGPPARTRSRAGL
jgi:hypothetical protein